MYAEILNGIRHSEFQVVYQPQMTADGARMTAVEALVRWKHPTRGALGPGDFVEMAERNGAINELGVFVLRQACLDALHWTGISVAVNVSAVQLRDTGFAESVENIVRETGFPFDRVELEIVESALIENFDLAVSAISRLRRLGIKIALDDFGTGYSSLTYLRKLPLDKIKIDKSFVDEVGMVQSASIVHGVVAIARALGLKIVAEGVETVEQQRFLRICGCHYLQGYLFSKPVSAHEIAELVSVQTPRRVG
jgi:EAL domain-containing protein (putative c-di-GMP-specific phosphodiesterase class I)